LNRDEALSRRQSVSGLATFAGPLLLVLGWIVLLRRAGQGPDFGWFFSHALLLSGVVLLVPAILGLRHLLGHHAASWADVGTGLAILGVLAHTGQYAIDLVVGHLAFDQAEMSALFIRISEAPGITIPFQLAGPSALYVGLLILLIGLFSSRIIPSWAAAVVALGIIAVGAGAALDSGLVTLLGFLGLWVGLVPVGRIMRIGSVKPR